jgi:RHS repeat-associated protein
VSSCPSFYRGEQYDPDLSLYYLRARYYNPVTGRFLNVDSLAGDGQRRYEYAGANPVDGSDPSGNFVLASYWPLMAPLTIHFPWPSWCGGGAADPMSNFLPPCSKPHWTVRVNYRPILSGKKGCDENLGIPSCSSLPFRFAEHTYVEIDPPADSGEANHTWGVLGVKEPKWDNQEMVKD